jgi:hypothetical protein
VNAEREATLHGKLALGAWVFPIVLWLFASAFLIRDLGWWNDDYFFNRRNPGTGAWPELILRTRDPFLPPMSGLNPWRPLHLTGTAALVTLTWEHPWVCHLVGTAIHGLNGLLFFLLLRGLGRSVHAAATAVMLFMAWPTHYEAVLWPSSFCNPLANACFLAQALCMVRWGRTGRTGAAWCVPFFAAVMIGFYEQPAGMLMALPLMYGAGRMARGGGEVQESESSAVRDSLGKGALAWRALWPTALAGLVVVAYIVNLRVNGQAGLGTNKEGYISAQEWPRRMREVFDSMTDQWLFQRGFTPNAFKQGWLELKDRGWYSIAWGAALAAGAAIGWWRWTRTPTHASALVRNESVRTGATLLIGIVLLFGAMQPLVAMQGYPANARTFYSLCMAGMVILAAVADALGAAVALWDSRGFRIALSYRATTGVILLAFVFWLAVMYVGAQSRWSRIYLAGQDQGRQLRELVPNPEKDTMFLPVNNYSLPVHTGEFRFDMRVMDNWRFSWSTPYFIKWVYGRSDVYAGFWANDYMEQMYRGVDASAVTFYWGCDSPYQAATPEGFCRIPHEKTVPFVIDPLGKVHVITRWRIRGDGGESVVEPAQTAALVKAGKIPEFEWTWPLPEGWKK